MDAPKEAVFLAPVEEALDGQQAGVKALLDELARGTGEARTALDALNEAVVQFQARAEADGEALRAALAAAREEGGGGAAQDALQEQVDRLEQELAAAHHQAENSAKRMAEWEAEAKGKADAAEAAEQLAADLRQALEDREQETQALQRQLTEARQALEDRAQDNALQEQLDELGASRTALEADLEKVRQQLADRDAAFSELQAVSARQADEQSALEDRVREAEEAQAALAQELADAAAAGEDAAGLQATLDARDEELDTLRTRLEEAETEAAAWRMKSESAPDEAELDKLRDELSAEKERAAGLEEQLEVERRKGTKSALAEQLAEALKEAEDAQAEVRRLKKALGATPNPVADVPAAPLRNEADEDLEARILAAAKGGKGKRSIGEILEAAGVVTREQIDTAMDEQRKNPMKHLGGIFVELGYASPEAVAQALACQCDVRFVRLDESSIDGDAASLIHARLAQQHTCIPISSDGNRLKLALVNPMDLLAIEDVERSSGREVEVVVATADDIRSAIEKFYWEPE